MKVYNEIVFDVDGEVIYEDSYEYSGDVILMQGNCASQCTEAYAHSQYSGDMCIQNCENLGIDPEVDTEVDTGTDAGVDTDTGVDTGVEDSGEGPQQSGGNVRCADGTIANSLGECPQLIDYEEDVGYEAEGQFITDDPTTDVDESMRDIYQAIGGGDWTGQTLEEFTAMYASDFPTWAGSATEEKSDLIESKLGMLPELMDLSKRGLDLEYETSKFQAGTELEGILDNREAMIRAGGGMQTGQMEDKVQSTYDRVLSGFDLQQEGIDIKRASSLFDFEGRRLDYQMDLSTIKSDFQDKMWDLISGSLDKYKGAEGEGTCLPASRIDACGTCDGGVTDESQCPTGGEGSEGSGEQGEQGEDPHDTYDDALPDADEERDYEDYWDDQGLYS